MCLASLSFCSSLPGLSSSCLFFAFLLYSAKTFFWSGVPPDVGAGVVFLSVGVDNCFFLFFFLVLSFFPCDPFGFGVDAPLAFDDCSAVFDFFLFFLSALFFAADELLLRAVGASAMVKLRQVLTHTAADRNNTVRQPKGNGATPPPPQQREGARGAGTARPEPNIASPRRRRVSTTREAQSVPRGRPSHRGRRTGKRTKGSGVTPTPPRRERARGTGTARPRQPSHPRVGAASQRRAIHQIFRAGDRPTVDEAPTDGPKGMEQPPSPRGRSVHTALGRRGRDDRRIPASPPLLNDARTAKYSARSGRKLPHLSTEAARGKGGEEGTAGRGLEAAGPWAGTAGGWGELTRVVLRCAIKYCAKV